MKQYIEICNDGEIELAGLTLIGASTKEGQDKIGFFGSGNKYAITTLLRENIDFYIFSGESRVEITTKEAKLRDETFQQVYINGEPTSFTTRMGPKWEVWFALREFICNAIDEQNKPDVWQLVDSLQPEPGKTKIYVSLTKKVKEFVDNINNYIATKRPVISEFIHSEFGTVRVLEKFDQSNMKIYRRSIKIYEGFSPSCFDYDVENIEINESRLLEYTWRVRDILLSCFENIINRRFVEKVLLKTDSHEYEHLKSISSWLKIPETWYEVLGQETLVSEEMKILRGATITKTARVLPQNLLITLMNRRYLLDKYQISISGFDERIPSVKIRMSKEIRTTLNEKIKNIRRLGFDFNLKVNLMKVLKHEDVVAWYNNKTNEIYINSERLDNVDEECLLEEYFHSLGYDDCSRSFQNFLIKQLIAEREKHLKIKELL